MFSRIFWRIITPRQLRRSSLILLLAWFAVALANQSGLIPQAPEAGRPPAAVHHPAPDTAR